jgi:DNA-binding winged helix-turn-helix (wHTH) protein
LPMPSHVYAGHITVGPFLLNTAERRLLRDGLEVKLRPQAFNALWVLAQNASQDVDYDQLILKAWGGVTVSRHTLEVTVAEVKKVLGEYGSWISRRPKLGYCLEIPQSDELVRNGWHFWNQRTHEALERALDCFQRAVQENGSDFRARDGLAQSYLMLGLYGVRPPGLMSRCFLEAQQRALELTGWTPSLRCAYACWLHMFERRYAESEREFLKTLNEQPDLVLGYVRLSLLYTTLGRLDEALDTLLSGKEIDPLYPAMPGTEAFIRLCRREIDGAVACGKRAVELFPHLEISRMFYAQALECAGQVAEALAQYQTGHALSPEAFGLRALEGACLAKNGRREEALSILDELRCIGQSRHLDPYYTAVLLDAAGRREAAFAELERAIEEDSTSLFKIEVDPSLDSLREDSRFERLRFLVFRDTVATGS